MLRVYLTTVIGVESACMLGWWLRKARRMNCRLEMQKVMFNDKLVLSYPQSANIRYLLMIEYLIAPMGNTSLGLPVFTCEKRLLGFFDLNKYAVVSLHQLSNTVQQMVEAAFRIHQDLENEKLLVKKEDGCTVAQFITQAACEWDTNVKQQAVLG